MMNSTSSKIEFINNINGGFSSITGGIVSDEDFITLTDILTYVMLVVSLVGVATNSINIKTFVSMGLEDGITISLVGLAISDLGFTFFGCVLSCSRVLSTFEVKHELKHLPIEPKFVFGMFAANLGYICYQVTIMITTFMAVARCMCVAMPFHFKNYFTRSKSITALVLFVFVAIACYVPLLSQMGTQSKFDPIVNKTRIVLWMSNERPEFKNVVSFIHFVVFVFVSTFVVVICVAVMAKYLQESVTFRLKSSTPSGEKSSVGNKLSGKELQVVRQVIIICIIYTVCMLPTVLYAIFRLIDDDFHVGGRLHNLHHFVASVGMTLELVNSATTFPVYYVYNSKFRSHYCFFQGGTEKGQLSRSQRSVK